MPKIKNFLAVLAVAPLALTQPQIALAQDKGCNSTNAAVGGALLGALIGGLAGRNHGQGVLIGSAIGAAVSSIACVAVNSKVTKQRTNEQVVDQYRPQIGDSQSPVLISYSSTPDQQAYQLGQQITIRDHIVVAMPQNDQSSTISEKFLIRTPSGETKTFTKPVSQSGGDLNNELSFQLPTAMPRGVYTVQSQISVNDNPIGTANTTFQVV